MHKTKFQAIPNDPFYNLTIYLSALFIHKSIKSKSIPRLPPEWHYISDYILHIFRNRTLFFFYPEAMYMYIKFLLLLSYINQQSNNMHDNANFEENKIGLLFKIHVYSNAIFDIITCFTKGIKYMIMLQEKV